MLMSGCHESGFDFEEDVSRLADHHDRGPPPLAVTPAHLRGVGQRARDHPELQEHGQMVVHRPAFYDTMVVDPVGKGGVTGVAAGGDLEATEAASGPVAPSGPELHHEVAFADHEQFLPAERLELSPVGGQPLPGPFEARRGSDRAT